MFKRFFAGGDGRGLPDQPTGLATAKGSSDVAEKGFKSRVVPGCETSDGRSSSAEQTEM